MPATSPRSHHHTSRAALSSLLIYDCIASQSGTSLGARLLSCGRGSSAPTVIAWGAGSMQRQLIIDQRRLHGGLAWYEGFDTSRIAASHHLIRLRCRLGLPRAMAQSQNHQRSAARRGLPGQPGSTTTVAVDRPQLSFWEMPEAGTEVRLVDTVVGLNAAAELLPMCDACGIDAGG